MFTSNVYPMLQMIYPTFVRLIYHNKPSGNNPCSFEGDEIGRIEDDTLTGKLAARPDPGSGPDPPHATQIMRSGTFEVS
jgi:hypothetical protein